MKRGLPPEKALDPLGAGGTELRCVPLSGIFLSERFAKPRFVSTPAVCFAAKVGQTEGGGVVIEGVREGKCMLASQQEARARSCKWTLASE